MDKLENKEKTAFENKQNETVWKAKAVGLTCPNCGSTLEGRKCKLFCTRPGCGYMVTCSEF
jgi:hypothetical protein